MSRYKNILFDFGNVLFDLDLDRAPRQLQALLGDRYEAVFKQLQRDHVFELYETGGLDTGEFVQAVCAAGAPLLSPEQVIEAWNAIFIGMPRERFDLLLRLRQHYRVFLLSNINDLHARYVDDYLLREHNIRDFETRYFDGVYYSHLIRLRKPTPEAFEYVLADAEILPGETLFIDDVEANVAAARALGIAGQVHPVGADIMTRIDRYLMA